MSASDPAVGVAKDAGGISAGDPPVDAARDMPAIPSTDAALLGRFPFEARFACAIAEFLLYFPSTKSATNVLRSARGRPCKKPRAQHFAPPRAPATPTGPNQGNTRVGELIRCESFAHVEHERFRRRRSVLLASGLDRKC